MPCMKSNTCARQKNLGKNDRSGFITRYKYGFYAAAVVLFGALWY